MPTDFTYEMYTTLLDAGLETDLEFITFREYCTREPLPERFVVLRHDVDRKPGNALDFAQLEADRGISSTYYVRTVPSTFEPALVQEIERLGHEVGYHYEDMDRTDGDVTAAHHSFARELARLRAFVTVDTVCMHGNPLTPHDNRDMWTDLTELERYGLVGEAYLSMDFTDVCYYSDTGRTWRDGALKVKDHPVGPGTPPRQVGTTAQLVAQLRTDPSDRYCLLSHPDRWADTELERVLESTFDRTKNAGKYVMQLTSTVRGTRWR